MLDRSIFVRKIAQSLMQIREQQPLIHNITNYVAMSLNANALLAIGASPIMAHAPEEVTDIVQLAKALVINIGTLDRDWLSSMSLAMQTAKEKSIPIVIDPVGAGATSFRTQAVLGLLERVAPQVIRGNASEILALAGQPLGVSKGVDSVYQSETACEAAQQLAKSYGCTVVVSGQQDFIIDHDNTYIIENGVELMRYVTTMGCTATALVGAFCTVGKDYALAATYAMAVMGIAGELALLTSQGPGSFQANFLDALYRLQEAEILARLKLRLGSP
jgi:hydroxyethylthiazole kinase